MNQINVLIQPIISEKSFNQSETGIYHFRVALDSNKKIVKDAIEKKFKVNVEKINVVNVKGKKVLNWRTRRAGRRSDYKKAIVTLKAGQTIDIFK